MAQTDLGLIRGNTIETGETLPSSAFNGDLFYNTSDYHIYQWDASLSTPTWVDKGSIRGPKGDTGDTATKLATARTIALSGGATGTATAFDGSGNITIPVTSLDPATLSGTVPVSNGGTGAATAKSAIQALNADNSAIFEDSHNTTSWHVVATATLSIDYHNLIGVFSFLESFFPSKYQGILDLNIRCDNSPSIFFAQAAFYGTPTNSVSSNYIKVFIKGMTVYVLSKVHAQWGSMLVQRLNNSHGIGDSNTYINDSLWDMTVTGTGIVDDTKLAATYGTEQNITFYTEATEDWVTNTAIAHSAATATKLATARTIALSGGATGTATAFDGTSNINIPITSLDATKLIGTASISTTGNAATATKATQDGDGNVISSTYATNTAVTGLSDKINGMTVSYVYDTLNDAEAALTGTDTKAQFKLGDSLFIKDTGTPDLWISGQTEDGEWETSELESKFNADQYYDTTTIDGLLAGKQDTLTAGDNISISNGVISATAPTLSINSEGHLIASYPD